MKKERNITYEELMNSHFMRFPTHSRIVHIIFNPLVIAAVLIPAIGLVAWLLGVDIMLAVFTAIIAGGYVPMRQFQAHTNMKGHGVGMRKKGRFSFLGLTSFPSIGSIIMIFILLTMTVLSFVGDFGHPQTALNFKVLSTSLLVSFIFSLLSWRFHTYYETWYGDEYDARLEFKKRGLPDWKIEENIKMLRKAGILP